MLTLIIDTSTERGIVAITSDDQILFSQDLPFGALSSKHLLSSIQLAFKTLNISSKDLGRIGIGLGPGMFTGIRVGVATAKGLAFPRSLPLVGFSSLHGFISPKDGPFASVIDARVGGIYCLLQERRGDEIIALGTPYLCDPSHVQHLPVVGPSFQRLNFPNSTETSPNVSHLSKIIAETPSSPLEILYLRNPL